MSGDRNMLDELMKWLLSPASYQDGTRSVELQETHISCVFLTERFAYKLKKPVNFDFADFSSLESRFAACQAEVRLNRRLTTDVYLGVVPVRRDPLRRFTLSGVGQPIDWLVKMRRLDERDTLLNRIKARLPSEQEIESVVCKLADFYRVATRSGITPEAYCEAIRRHVCANQARLLATSSCSSDAIRRVHQRQLRYLALNRDSLRRRVIGGRIVDGHGDLRPEHIFLEQPPQIIDCIEFSDEYRQLDIADEVCFLSMECDRLGASLLGRQFLERCEKACRDEWPPELVDFYRAYRACVRAKIAALRSLQAGAHAAKWIDEVNDYLRIAESYLRRVGKPLLIIVGGFMGSGKSTLAARLGNDLGADVFSTDAVRRLLFGGSPTPMSYAQGAYQPQNRAKVYDELFQFAAEQLGHGLSVILDGTFLTTALKRKALAIAAEHEAIAVHLRCVCPKEIALARIARRQQLKESMSEARPELLTLQMQEVEPDPKGLWRFDVDTTQQLDEQVSQSCEFLAELCEGRN
jgi:aminoglycoside phosphotransferase family enzyme/predicted kinase